MLFLSSNWLIFSSFRLGLSADQERNLNSELSIVKLCPSAPLPSTSDPVPQEGTDGLLEQATINVDVLPLREAPWTIQHNYKQKRVWTKNCSLYISKWHRANLVENARG